MKDFQLSDKSQDSAPPKSQVKSQKLFQKFFHQIGSNKAKPASGQKARFAGQQWGKLSIGEGSNAEVGTSAKGSNLRDSLQRSTKSTF